MSKKDKRIQVLDKSDKVKCWGCEGTGIKRKKGGGEQCELCEGKGVWTEPNYHLIATTPSGQKIAFQCDNAGK